MKSIMYWLLLGAFFPLTTSAQHSLTPAPDSAKTDDQLPLKLLHAEPLYIDLIRDLGARKGEKEWNVGMGMADHLRYDSYEFLVEYEWAPMDRLGLEIEVPLTLYSPTDYGRNNGNGNNPEFPADRVESLKLAAQYTFWVSERFQTSMAVGGITELELRDLPVISWQRPLQGILFNPFLIAAKRWGTNFHSLIYTGPRILTHLKDGRTEWGYEINTNFHYMIPGSRNFVGIEFNKIIENGDFGMVIRPQMRLSISDGLMLGVVPGIPVSRDQERLSAFLRLIYEPGHKH